MTTTNPTEGQMKLAREALAQAATELAPPSSSMRMNDFTDKAAQISARAIVLAIQATEARAQVLVDALEAMLHAVCHETGFANAVRNDSGVAYPWEPLDIAEASARQALATWRQVNG